MRKQAGCAQQRSQAEREALLSLGSEEMTGRISSEARAASGGRGMRRAELRRRDARGLRKSGVAGERRAAG